MRLQDKVVVVTGGSSGIGLAAAKRFVAEGARVAVTGRDAKKLGAVREELGVLSVQADSNDFTRSQRAFAEIAEKLGKLDGVFVNAGIGGATPLGATEPERFEEIVRTNFSSAFFTTQAALPHLNDGASLVYNGSVLASNGLPGYSAYGGAKGAIRAMVRVVASELAPRRIRANQVTPGATRTPIWDGLVPIEALERLIAAAAPLGRLAEVDEIAGAVLFLLSDESRFVTGTEIVVDGGVTQSPAGAPAFRAG